MKQINSDIFVDTPYYYLDTNYLDNRSVWQTSTSGRFAVHFLLFLGLSEGIISQISYLLPFSQFGALSILQYYRGTAWLLLQYFILMGTFSKARRLWEVKYFYVFAHLCLILWSMRSVLRGDIILGDIIQYFKMSYWISWWFCIYLHIQTAKQARLLLTVLIIGVSFICLFVYWGYFSGKGIVSTYEQAATASFGIEGSSGKNVPASLAMGALLSVMFWKRSRSILPTLLTLFLLGSVMMTYRRSAQAGLVLALALIGLWRIFYARISRDVRYADKLIFIVCLGFILFVSYTGLTGLQNRWTWADGNNTYRVKYWMVAINHFLHQADFIEFFFGASQSRMLKSMVEAGQSRIHTHSGPFDMLFYGGITGCLFYGFLWYVFLKLLRKCDFKAIESAIAGGILCVFFSMSFLSGQLGAVNSMFICVAAMTCLPMLSYNDR